MTKPTKTASNAGAALVSHRRRKRKKCAKCGRGFLGWAKKIYCSEKCKQAAKREREQEARMPKRKKPAVDMPWNDAT